MGDQHRKPHVYPATRAPNPPGKQDGPAAAGAGDGRRVEAPFWKKYGA